MLCKKKNIFLFSIIEHLIVTVLEQLVSWNWCVLWTWWEQTSENWHWFHINQIETITLKGFKMKSVGLLRCLTLIILEILLWRKSENQSRLVEKGSYISSLHFFQVRLEDSWWHWRRHWRNCRGNIWLPLRETGASRKNRSKYQKTFFNLKYISILFKSFLII